MHDGTTTKMVTDFAPGTPSSFPIEFAEYNNELYMSALKGINMESELYRLADATGVQHVSLQGTVSVSPNPTNNDALLKLDLQQAYTCSITLTDAMGKAVWRSAAQPYAAGESRVVLPLVDQPSGMYFYHLSSGGRMLASGKMVRR